MIQIDYLGRFLHLALFAQEGHGEADEKSVAVKELDLVVVTKQNEGSLESPARAKSRLGVELVISVARLKGTALTIRYFLMRPIEIAKQRCS